MLTTPGIQSPDQQAALARHNPAQPIFVEGPFSLWLRNKCVYYHILRAELVPPEERVRTQILNGEWCAVGWHCPEGWWGLTDCEGMQFLVMVGGRLQVAARSWASDSACIPPPPSRKWKKFQRNGTSTTRCSWTWTTGGVAGMTMSLTSMKVKTRISRGAHSRIGVACGVQERGPG